ncbi:MAG: ROK family protein [Geminicoccaceae bacterium]
MDIAIDIGGTKLAAARIERGDIVARRMAPTPDDDPDALIDALATLCDDWISPARMIAIAVTGVFRNGHVYAVNKKIITRWDGYPLAKRLAQRFGAEKVYRFLNDAVAACWAEYWMRRQRSRSMIYVTVSTGVGGGLVIDGKLVLGAGGKAGHFGHIPIAWEPRCGCGRDGCVEALASGQAIAREASALLGRPVDARWVFEHLDRMAELQPIVDASASAIAGMLDRLEMVVDMDLVVIGGGVGLASGYLDMVRSNLGSERHFAVEPALLGPDSGLSGVARWASDTPSS